jgi:hypothetical protein
MKKIADEVKIAVEDLFVEENKNHRTELNSSVIFADKLKCLISDIFFHHRRSVVNVYGFLIFPTVY